MAQVKDQNFYTVHGWMVNRLKLNGNALHVYAIIYGFTQDGESEFCGSLGYITAWLGTTSKHTALRAIDELLRRGLITKQEVTKEGGGRGNNIYKITDLAPFFEPPPPSAETTPGVVPERHQGWCRNDTRGSAETAPNNNIYNNNNNINTSKSKSGEKEAENAKADPVPFSDLARLYNVTCRSFSAIVKLSTNRQKAVRARWNEYKEPWLAFETLFKKAEASDFLKGKNARGWKATFDWLVKADNMAKVLEGNYDNKGGGNSGNNATVRGSCNNLCREMSTAELEAELGGQYRGPVDFDKMLGDTGTND